MDKQDHALLRQTLDNLPYPVLFATVSGAHLYGFPSPDSDFDLRGSYVLPQALCLGSGKPEETVTLSHKQDEREIDLVTHDVRKFLTLLLNKNGYVLEQLYSPLVVYGGPRFDELRSLGRDCVTRLLFHHYSGFARGQMKHFEVESPLRVKTLLYIYRVLMTGIFVLETGQIESNLPRLNNVFRLPFIPDLIAKKQCEDAVLAEADLAIGYATVAELQQRLENAFIESSLPEAPTNRSALNDFLLRVRLEMDDG